MNKKCDECGEDRQMRPFGDKHYCVECMYNRCYICGGAGGYFGFDEDTNCYFHPDCLVQVLKKEVERLKQLEQRMIVFYKQSAHSKSFIDVFRVNWIIEMLGYNPSKQSIPDEEESNAL